MTLSPRYDDVYSQAKGTVTITGREANSDSHFRNDNPSPPPSTVQRHPDHNAKLRRCIIRLISGPNASKGSLIDQLPPNICTILHQTSRSHYYHAGEVFGIASVQRRGIYLVDCGYAQDASMTTCDALTYYLYGPSKGVNCLSSYKVLSPKNGIIASLPFRGVNSTLYESGERLGIIPALLDRLLTESRRGVSVSFFSFASIDKGVTDLFLQLLPVMMSRKVSSTRDSHQSGTLCAINVTSLEQFNELISHVTSSYPFRMARPHLSFCFVITAANHVVNTIVILRPEHQEDVISILEGNISQLPDHVQEMIKLEEVVNGIDINTGLWASGINDSLSEVPYHTIPNVYGSYAGLQHIPSVESTTGLAQELSISKEYKSGQMIKQHNRADEVASYISPEEMEANRFRRLLAANVFAQLRRSMSALNHKAQQVIYYKPLYTVRILEGHTEDNLNMIPFIRSMCDITNDDDCNGGRGHNMYRIDNISSSATREYWTMPNASEPKPEDLLFNTPRNLMPVNNGGINGTTQKGVNQMMSHNTKVSNEFEIGALQNRTTKVMSPNCSHTVSQYGSHSNNNTNVTGERGVGQHNNTQQNSMSLCPYPQHYTYSTALEVQYNHNNSGTISNMPTTVKCHSEYGEDSRECIFTSPTYPQIVMPPNNLNSFNCQSGYQQQHMQRGPSKQDYNNISVNRQKNADFANVTTEEQQVKSQYMSIDPISDNMSVRDLENSKEIAIKSFIDVHKDSEELLCEFSKLLKQHEPLVELLRSEKRELEIIKYNEETADYRTGQLDRLIVTAKQEIEDLQEEMKQIDNNLRELGSKKEPLLAHQKSSVTYFKDQMELLERTHANNVAIIRKEGESEIWKLKERIQSDKKDYTQSEAFIKKDIATIEKESEDLVNKINKAEHIIQTNNTKLSRLDAERQKMVEKISQFYELDKSLEEANNEKKIIEEKLNKVKNESSMLESDIRQLELTAPPVVLPNGHNSNITSSDCHDVYNKSLMDVSDAQRFVTQEHMKWISHGHLRVMETEEYMERNVILLKEFERMLYNSLPIWRNTERLSSEL